MFSRFAAVRQPFRVLRCVNVNQRFNCFPKVSRIASLHNSTAVRTPSQNLKPLKEKWQLTRNEQSRENEQLREIKQLRENEQSTKGEQKKAADRKVDEEAKTQEIEKNKFVKGLMEACICGTMAACLVAIVYGLIQFGLSNLLLAIILIGCFPILLFAWLILFIVMIPHVIISWTFGSR